MAGVTALVLAGGKGTRIAGLYPDIPKPMIPVAGRPFLHWITAWLVASGVRDIVAWLEIREATNSSLLLQTSPSKDISLVTTVATASPATPGVTATAILMDTATVPLARWLFWQVNIATGGSGDLCFRLWIATNSPGRPRMNRARA